MGLTWDRTIAGILEPLVHGEIRQWRVVPLSVLIFIVNSPSRGTGIYNLSEIRRVFPFGETE